MCFLLPDFFIFLWTLNFAANILLNSFHTFSRSIILLPRNELFFFFTFFFRVTHYRFLIVKLSNIRLNRIMSIEETVTSCQEVQPKYFLKTLKFWLKQPSVADCIVANLFLKRRVFQKASHITSTFYRMNNNISEYITSL